MIMEKKKTVIVESTSSDRDVKASLKDNRITELSINGETIPKKEFEKHEQEIRSIIDEQNIQADIANADVETIVNDTIKWKNLFFILSY